MYKKYLKPIFTLAILITLYHIKSIYGGYNIYVLPSINAIFIAFIELLKNNELYMHIFSSLSLVFLGYIISFVLAFTLATLSYTTKFKEYFNFLIQFMKNVPPLSLIPLLILWFGINTAPKLIIIILASFFPMYLNMEKGFRYNNKKLIEVGITFGFSKNKIFKDIVLPNAIPDILIGMRIGMGYSYRAIIGAEMIAASSGLGYLINFARSMSRTDIVIVGILVIGLLGYTCDYLFILLTKPLLRGRDISEFN